MQPLIVGVAGGSGSGKSTVAHRVVQLLAGAPAAYLEMDAYYRNFAHLPMDARRQINWDHPEQLDLALFTAHLETLRSGHPVERPVYDFVTHTRAPETIPVPAAPVVVVDGILLFVDERVRALCDIKVFVDTDPDVRLVRRIRRDMSRRGRPLPEILEQYLSTVRPMHQQFVEPSKQHADLIVPDGGHNAVAVAMIVSHVQRRLDGVPG